MFVIGDVLVGVGQVLSMLLEVYMWIVIIRAVLSWVRPDPYNPIVRFIYGLVDPVTHRLSRFFPTRVGMVDISPIILIIAIYVMKLVVVRIIIDTGLRLR
jgi:YggT family protein